MENENKNNPMLKIAAFIVDKRNLFFLIFSILVIFSLVSKNWVSVENALSAYLPETSETSKGLDLMEEEFTTFGTTKVMVSNITYEEAETIVDQLEHEDYVGMVQFDNTTDHYNDFSALFDVTFRYSEDDDRALEALDSLKEFFKNYDAYFSTELGDQSAELIDQQMGVITIFVAIIVVAVLLFTTESFAEVPVLVITFLVSSALATGTNFMLGTISFVSDSVTIVLQLALSIDYAVIFLNRYKDELKSNDVRNADIIALSKAIPEITASSLTTIGGLLAMSFMQFGIGPDMAVVLIKAILFSLVVVFTLMPGLIILFAGLMEKTKHKNFVPKIPFVGKFAYATHKIIPFVFVALIAVFFYFQSNTPYVYGYSLLSTPTVSEQDEIDAMIDDTFGTSNYVALIVPSGDYDKEAKLLEYLDTREEVKSSTGLANTEAMDGTMLTEKLTSRQFAELIDVDKEIGDLLYSAYAINDENYGRLISGIGDYKVPFIDMFMFLYDEIQDGYVTLDKDQQKTVDDAYNKIVIAKEQLHGENYDRMLIYLNLPEEGDETFAFLDELHDIAKIYYGEDANILVAGESTSQYDLCKTFATDNLVVTIVSILAVLVVLLFTFKSVGMPVLLIIVIEGCIWINFGIPTIMNENIFFMGYLIVSSIQMGANIDYAIVVSSRYQEVKKIMPKKDAIIETMNFAFPTIITSGTMMVMAGILISQLTSEPCICGIGECLARGTIISIFTVLFVLPQILLLGDRIIDKTSFDVNLDLAASKQTASGIVRVDGIVQGKIDGYFVGTMRGIIRGNFDGITSTGTSIKSLDQNISNDSLPNDNNDDLNNKEEGR